MMTCTVHTVMHLMCRYQAPPTPLPWRSCRPRLETKRLERSRPCCPLLLWYERGFTMLCMHVCVTLPHGGRCMAASMASTPVPVRRAWTLMQEEAMERTTDSLAVISFSMWDATMCQTYNNVDMSLEISVSALYFLCNRPTVAALMCFGQDIVFPNAPTREKSPANRAEASTEFDTLGHSASHRRSSMDDAGRSTLLRTSHDTPALSGGSKRTIFKLSLVVSKLELQLSYEGFQVTPLLQCNVSDFDMDVNVHPETLLLTAQLGNAQVEDLSLPDNNPYRLICGLRNDMNTSLISTEFRCACWGAVRCLLHEGPGHCRRIVSGTRSATLASSLLTRIAPAGCTA
jgi:hypothetical protein